MRDYSMKTIKILFGRAVRCAYPDCRESLVFEDRGQLSITAEIAHIRSGVPGGPRYDPDYPLDLIDDEQNLLLLCGKHHKAIDDHESVYTVNELLTWKQQQVAEVSSRALSGDQLAQILRHYEKMTRNPHATAPSIVVQASNVHDGACVNPGTAFMGPLFAVPARTKRVVTRTRMLASLIDALCEDDLDGQSEITTVALVGAGGFGKSTLAAEACREDRIRRRFPDGILWVTIGEQLTGTDLVVRIDELATHLSGERPTFTTEEQAAHHLGRLLEGGRRLLVIDDIWHGEQLRPFLVGGSNCARLVTTRVHSAVPAAARVIRVDAMDRDEAIKLLTDGIDTSALGELDDLLRHTDGCPIMLSLVNGALRSYISRGLPLAEAISKTGQAIDRRGPAAHDMPGRTSREEAVAGTIEASLKLLEGLGSGCLERYLELAVFPPDAHIPLSTLMTYWRYTGGLHEEEVERLCLTYADLSLLQDLQLSPPRLRMHDLFLEYVRSRVGDQVRRQHRDLVESHRKLLPAAPPGRAAWWELPDHEPYLWNNLVGHISSATDENRGTPDGELESLVLDLRWVEARLRLHGPAAVEADLSLVASFPATQLRQAITQNSHLLAVLEPAHALGATLVSRLSGTLSLQGNASAYLKTIENPVLSPTWPLPDRPHPALWRVIPVDSVAASTVSPDGSFFVTASDIGSIWFWDPETGRMLHSLDAPEAFVKDMTITPDGKWLVAVGGNEKGAGWLWDLKSWELRAVVECPRPLRKVAVSPDGTWFSGLEAYEPTEEDGVAHMWTVPAGELQGTLVCEGGTASVLHVAPDGSWIGVGGRKHASDQPKRTGPRQDGLVWIWNTNDRSLRKTWDCDSQDVLELVADPEGRWIATVSFDAEVKVWDLATGELNTTLKCHGSPMSAICSPCGRWLAAFAQDTMTVLDLASGKLHTATVGNIHRQAVIAPDSSWLAGARSGIVQICDFPSGNIRAVLKLRNREVKGTLINAPDRSWLAHIGSREIRIWKAPGKILTEDANRSYPVRDLAASRYRSWLATADTSGIRIWDTRNRVHWTSLELDNSNDAMDFSEIRCVAVSSDGSRLALGGGSGNVLILDVRSGKAIIGLKGHAFSVTAVAFAPTGAWVASVGDGMIQLFDLRRQEFSVRIDHPEHAVTAIAAAPDGHWIASGGDDGRVKIWGTSDGGLQADLLGHSGPVHAVATAPDGHWIASGGDDGRVKIWGTSDGGLRADLLGHSGPVHAVATAPDGHWIASGGTDGEVRIWDAQRNLCITAIRIDGQIDAIAWMPSGDEITVGGINGIYQFRLYDNGSTVDKPDQKRRSEKFGHMKLRRLFGRRTPEWDGENSPLDVKALADEGIVLMLRLDDRFK